MIPSGSTINGNTNPASEVDVAEIDSIDIMSTAIDPIAPPPPGAFANMLVGKRRRMRTVSSGQKEVPPGAVASSTTKPEKKKSKGKSGGKQEGSCDPNKPSNTTIPIFLKKTYKMIDTCDPTVASWTDDGEMFVVKDPDVFASRIIPQYFDHNKFSSFARQLNFYGFRKMQAKPIRNADFNAATAKYVTFYNEKFKRGRCDLLKEIQRSTRGGNSANANVAEQQKEIEGLKAHIGQLEQKMEMMNSHFEERLRSVELNMLGQMERMMVALGHQPQPSTGVDSQQQQQARANMQRSNTGASSSTVSSISVPGRQESWNPIPLMQQQQPMAGLGGSQKTQKATSGESQRTPSMSSEVSGGSQPTLPPHPKQKNLGPLPENMTNNTSNVPENNRFPSIGIGRGLSLGMSRGLSTESSSSAVIMKNSWEDKFFHSLMLGDNEGAAAAQQQMAASNAGGGSGVESMASGPVSDEAMQAAIAAAQRAQSQGVTAPNAVRQSTAAVLLEAANLSPDDI
mmetsp:Transcript_5766/g.12566  ORF Transcript_5766/g.12566 Transcript_5766/m.12566 type:complete len:511 (-) Transcript_5766:297-1829(-)